MSPMARYVILGAGHFGAQALKRLTARDPGGAFIVVDREAAILETLARQYPSGRMLAGDGIILLEDLLREEPAPDWIIPAIPRHVAFEWLARRHGATGGWTPVPVPPLVKELALLTFTGPRGELYLSMATGRCPDACAEQEDFCPQIGHHHRRPLYELLTDLAVPGYTMCVIRSEQLAPGVGGYPPARLEELAHRLASASGNFCIATACRCHAVVHAVSL